MNDNFLFNKDKIIMTTIVDYDPQPLSSQKEALGALTDRQGR